MTQPTRTRPAGPRGPSRPDPLDMIEDDDVATVMQSPSETPAATPLVASSDRPERTQPMPASAPSAIWESLTGLEAYDLLATPIILSDNDMRIRYVNRAAYEMFRPYEQDIRRDLPAFALPTLIGQSVDLFHKNPAHQRAIVAGMTEQMSGKLSAGGRHYAFSASPLRDPAGTLCGAIIEWRDATRDELGKNEGIRFIKAVSQMADAHGRGDIDHFIDPTDFCERNVNVLNNVNSMVLGHIETKRKIIACIAEFAAGNFDAPLETFPGKSAFINEAMEGVRANFKGVFSDIERMSEALFDGRLDLHVDLGIHKGQFGTLMTTLDRIRHNFRDVTSEIERLSNAIVQGELDTRIDPTEFKGAYRLILEAFEDAFTSLNGAFSVICHQVSQVSNTVHQMSLSSKSLATNSQIQSSSVDEVSATAEQTDIQVKSNAAAAASASQLVIGASEVAENGKSKIGEMVASMEGIRASSQDIAKIIKVIDEIAFQTNLLALNAAVEAARAGQHGRGFAVVAQEVRNLAGRSARAARETSELIEDAATRVQAGVRIADETSRAFVSIADDIEKVKSLVRDIASASDEQSRGVAQINLSIGEIAKSAVSTSQQAEDLAASAAEMQTVTESMRQAGSRYRLRPAADLRGSAGKLSLDQIPADLMAQIQSMIAGQMAGKPTPAPARAPSTGRTPTSDRDQRGYANF